MSSPIIQTAFINGEVAPSLFGRADLTRLHSAASTMRNMFVSYRGGSYSRAGTAFVGFSKQTGRSVPPRMVTFQFSINQGLALEFGNFYMRVIANGALVVEDAVNVTNVTKANPAVVTNAGAIGGLTASPNNGAVSSSYAPADTVTLAGGTFTSAAVVSITNTKLLDLALDVPGNASIYAPGNTVHLTGGTQSTPAVLTVNTTQVIAAIVSAAGTGGTPGTATVTGTTGSGTAFQAEVTIDSGGLMTAVNAITVPGSYTANPTTPGLEPVTGGGLTGAELDLSIGILTFTISNAGVFTANAPGGVFTQASSSGAGLNATFKFGLFAPNAVTFSTPGIYTTFPPNPVAQGGTSGTGLGVTFTVNTTAVAPFANGDWVYLTGIGGMTELNGETYVVHGASLTTFQLYNVYGDSIDSTAFTAYSGGGTAARIFTLVTPWAEADLLYLKFTQSADVMSICCINQETLAAYPPYDLSRVSDANWLLTAVAPGATISPPAATTGSSTAAGNINYQYVVTAISPVDSSESVASPIAEIDNAVDITATAGTIAVDWSTVPTASDYNIYKAQPSYLAAIPAGVSFGYVGTSRGGTQFLDSNLIADYTQVPPTHNNPFNGVDNYPAVVAYFQERRVYAYTLSAPDTYFMSQPGAFTNFDSRVPSIASDAIFGSPWSVQVNGIQYMVPMPGGLVVLTGLSAWQLTGTGGSSLNPQPITPSTQQAQPQAYNGCHTNIPPLRIDYDILYVQAKGSIVRDLSYQFYTNIYTGTDLTVNSSHLFTGFNIVDWAWCEEPYKVIWVIRDDGSMLALTFLKPQEVSGWSRCDTDGVFESVCAVTEPPVDALYLAVQRFPGTRTAYMIERMDNRLWSSVEDCWCVDCGLSLTQPTPNATLTASSATGLGACTGVTGLVGGSNWSLATTAVVIDAPMIPNGPTGPGTGARPSLTILAGVITAITFAGGQMGAGYLNPQLVFTDPTNTGSGAAATVTLDNSATFTASAAVFAPSNVGDVIRMGGGIATVTVFTDNEHVTANITSPITDVIPNSGGVIGIQTSGSWTMTTPISSVGNLTHLIGATVTGLADGNVIPPTVVAADGTIPLPVPATSVTIGLGFQAQLQSVYLDSGEPTVQGQRKKVAAVTARIEASRGLKIGSNQPDGSLQSPAQLAPAWSGLADVPDDGPNFPLKPYNAVATPLRTGDIRIPVTGGFATPGQVAIQQDNPLPMNILAIISDAYSGDLPQVQAPKRQGRGQEQ